MKSTDAGYTARDRRNNYFQTRKEAVAALVAAAKNQ